MGNESRGGGFSVGSGYRNNRNPERFALRIKHIDYRRGYVPWQSFAWSQMHAESGSSVHFQNRATAFLERLCKVFCHDINSTDIKTNNLGNTFAHGNVLGVNHICNIDGSTACRKVSGRFKIYHLTFLRDGVEGIIQFFKKFIRVFVDKDFSKHIFMPVASSGIKIFFIDELADI